jgi:hydrogenase maturation protease
MKTLILGIGNLLLGDEGVGVHAAHALSDVFPPEEVTVLDVGTAILDALPDIEKADRIVIVDAVKADGPPGSIYRIPIQDMAVSPVIASMHGFDFSRVLCLAGRSETSGMPEVIVIGVEPAHIGWSLELSPPVAQALPTVLAAVRGEVERAGKQHRNPETTAAKGIS